MTAASLTPVVSATPPSGWLSNQVSLVEAALAVAGMNYAASQGHYRFAGSRFVIDSAYFPTGADVRAGMVGIYRRGIL